MDVEKLNEWPGQLEARAVGFDSLDVEAKYLTYREPESILTVPLVVCLFPAIF